MKKNFIEENPFNAISNNARGYNHIFVGKYYELLCHFFDKL